MQRKTKVSKLLQVDALPHAHALDIIDIDGHRFGLDVFVQGELLAAKSFERRLGLEFTLGQSTNVVVKLAHFRNETRLNQGWEWRRVDKTGVASERKEGRRKSKKRRRKRRRRKRRRKVFEAEKK